MSTSPVTLGIDIGTTGARALLVRADGSVAAESIREYPLSTPHPQWSEQDPLDWWKATVTTTCEVLQRSGISAADVAAVGLTGQMHGLVLLDAGGNALRPCMLWNDQRTAAECAAATERIGLQRILQMTGNRILTGFTVPKLLWVRTHEPQVYAHVAHILLPKDYIRLRLTGEYRTDVSDASGTSLFDVAHRRWSDEMCAALDVPRQWLPEVSESPAVSGAISRSAAGETGLTEGTPVVGGAGDQAAQAVGAGIVDDGMHSITLGTSGVVFSPSRSYRPDPAGILHAFCHAVPGMWHLMGVMLAAGGSLRWYRDVLGEPERRLADQAGRDPCDVLIDAAQSAPPGCEGLLFLPYLCGERTPHPDPDARAVFFGITQRHTKAHLTRALLEGVAYGLRDCLERIRATGVPVAEVRASGGGARSAFWLQIIADVLNVPIVTTNATQGAAYGAALLASVGAGIHADVANASRDLIRVTGRYIPGEAADVYAEGYDRYRSLYPSLASHFKAAAGQVD